MGVLLNTFYDNLIKIFFMAVTGILSYLGIRLKKLYQEYIIDKLKKEIVEKTVNYVEQTGKNLLCADKKKKAIEKSSEWFKEKKISISDTELEILIESAVKCLKGI